MREKEREGGRERLVGDRHSLKRLGDMTLFSLQDLIMETRATATITSHLIILVRVTALPSDTVIYSILLPSSSPIQLSHPALPLLPLLSSFISPLQLSLSAASPLLLHLSISSHSAVICIGPRSCSRYMFIVSFILQAVSRAIISKPIKVKDSSQPMDTIRDRMEHKHTVKQVLAAVILSNMIAGISLLTSVLVTSALVASALLTSADCSSACYSDIISDITAQTPYTSISEPRSR